MEHPPEVWSIPPGTPCIYVEVFHYHYSGVAVGESQSPPPTPPPNAPHLQTRNTTKLSKETRGIHLMLIGTNKLTRMKMSEGRRSLL